MSERSAEKDAPCPHEHTRAFRDLQGGHVKCLDCGARITTAPRPAEHGLRRGWFADTADNPTGDYQWQPCLETGQGHIPCFEVWFKTKAECEEWIASNVIDVGFLPSAQAAQ